MKKEVKERSSRRVGVIVVVVVDVLSRTHHNVYQCFFFVFFKGDYHIAIYSELGACQPPYPVNHRSLSHKHPRRGTPPKKIGIIPTKNIIIAMRSRIESVGLQSIDFDRAERRHWGCPSVSCRRLLLSPSLSLSLSLSITHTSNHEI